MSVDMYSSAAPTPRGRLPGPRRAEYLRTLADAFVMNPAELVKRLADTHGDVVGLKIGRTQTVLVNRPEYIRQVLVVHKDKFVRSPTYDELGSVLGPGLLTVEGHEWRAQRRVCQPAFTAKAVHASHDIMLNAVRGYVDELGTEGRVIDTYESMADMTLSIAGQCFFGLPLQAGVSELADAVREAADFVHRRMMMPLRLPVSVRTPARVRLMRAIERLDAVVAELEVEAQRDLEGESLLHRLVRDGADEEVAARRAALTTQLLTFGVAGHETMASALTWTWYALARNPEMQQRVREEILDHCDREAPTEESLGQLAYTRAFFEETLRFYPPVWMFDRRVTDDHDLDGYHLPKGTLVAISPYAMQRHPDYWDAPERFNPERFMPGAAPIDKFAYLPFGAGPRKCIGEYFALRESLIALAMILPRFDVRLTTDAPVGTQAALSLRPKGPLHLSFVPR